MERAEQRLNLLRVFLHLQILEVRLNGKIREPEDMVGFVKFKWEESVVKEKMSLKRDGLVQIDISKPKALVMVTSESNVWLGAQAFKVEKGEVQMRRQ